MRRACVIALLPLLLASAALTTSRICKRSWMLGKLARKVSNRFDFHWCSKRFLGGQTFAAKPDGTVSPKRPESTFIWQYRFVSDANGHSRFEEKGRTWFGGGSDFYLMSAIYIYENNAERMSMIVRGDHGFTLMEINRSPPLKSISLVVPYGHGIPTIDAGCRWLRP